MLIIKEQMVAKQYIGHRLDKAASHLEFGAPLISLTIVIQGITSSGELVNFIRILKNEQ